MASGEVRISYCVIRDALELVDNFLNLLLELRFGNQTVLTQLFQCAYAFFDAVGRCGNLVSGFGLGDCVANDDGEFGSRFIGVEIISI